MTYAPGPALGYIVFAYICGAIPFGVVIGRMRGVDPRNVGSGNIGATNVMRALGPVCAAFVLLLDLLKGFIPVWLVAHVLTHPERVQGGAWTGFGIVCTAVAAMVGHNWSVFLRGKGGKGASTGFGVVLALDWRVGVLIALVMIVTVALTRYVSLGSTLGAWFVPLGMWWWHRGTVQLQPLLVFGILAALLITFKHRSNYKRLLNGSESKFGGKPAS
jgi:glycerol-3-phosphate acyltransferase PlsY